MTDLISTYQQQILRDLFSVTQKRFVWRIQLDACRLSFEDQTKLYSLTSLVTMQVNRHVSGCRVFLDWSSKYLKENPDDLLKALRVLEEWSRDGRIKQILVKTDWGRPMKGLLYVHSHTQELQKLLPVTGVND